MIKFVIGLIALIFVALTAYVYTGKKGKEVTKRVVTHKVVKEEVTESKVEKPVEVTKEVGTSVKQNVVEKKLTGKSTSSKEKYVISENEIGKGLTLESIENADVSDEEKERLLSELVSYESYKVRNEPSVAPEEDLERLKEIIEKNLK